MSRTPGAERLSETGDSDYRMDPLFGLMDFSTPFNEAEASEEALKDIL